MNPKSPFPNIKRREERRKVTLIAALVCRDAIVMAADSEESGGIAKANVEKMRQVPEGGIQGALAHDPRRNTSVIVSGAGNATLCDYAMQRVADEVRMTSNQQDALKVIRGLMVEIWRDHIPLYPANKDEAEFSLLIGLRSPDGFPPSLYSVKGTTAIKREKWFSFGSGSITDYILDQMHYERMMAEEGIAAALYMLQTAKKYISGVGGQSHILVLRSDGIVEEKPLWEISEEENISHTFNEFSGELLLSLLRTRTGTDIQFENQLTSFREKLIALRSKKKQSDKFWDDMLIKLEERIKEDENKGA